MGKVICLDPGHNGIGADTGAIGNNLKEQDITLDIGLKLKSLLQTNGFTVVMTREGQSVSDNSSVNASLQSRINVAENAKADLFVSIHINAGKGTGAEVLIYSSGGKAQICANKVLPYLVSAGQWANRGVKVENIMVLRETSMPAILGETGFIDTVNDAQKLANSDFRQSLAVAYCKGICDYFGVTYKQASPPSPTPSLSSAASEQIQNNNGDDFKMEHAVFYFTERDFSVARMINSKLGNCAMYCRNGISSNIHSDIKFIKHPIFVGGAEYHDNPNTTNCCGNHDYDTAILAGEYAKTL